MTQFQLEKIVRPIQPGDTGIVIGDDGKFFIFNTHEHIDPVNPTEMQEAHGEAIDALAAALQIPQVMDMLKKLAVDPAISVELPNIANLH